ncbi:DUF732 domain-containing protein [Mycobacterium sp.]|uniref:DUF732 domain-containing protein n=1 Tax=Mycobacterium sp. TaxID=1785 RepID=UPI001202C2C0|nr:DUF732 domain-containing protein [Mycobacterium sp.]TAM68988.1 MAG: DUF732 domain-containing protein [Mycobacterium sp.]
MRILVVLAGLVALGGAAALAQADPAGNSGSDASFLAALNRAGITYQSPAIAVGVGKRACELMDQGHPQVDVIHNMSLSNPGFTVDGAAQFTMIAANAYCPQHLGQLVAQGSAGP